jgi:hypothetical protein
MFDTLSTHPYQLHRELSEVGTLMSLNMLPDQPASYMFCAQWMITVPNGDSS